MLQQVVPQQETFSQNRAVALQSVESTITELSGIFTNLATMVAHQGELAIRLVKFMYISFKSIKKLMVFIFLNQMLMHQAINLFFNILVFLYYNYASTLSIY